MCSPSIRMSNIGVVVKISTSAGVSPYRGFAVSQFSRFSCRFASVAPFCHDGSLLLLLSCCFYVRDIIVAVHVVDSTCARAFEQSFAFATPVVIYQRRTSPGVFSSSLFVTFKPPFFRSSKVCARLPTLCLRRYFVLLSFFSRSSFFVFFCGAYGPLTNMLLQVAFPALFLLYCLRTLFCCIVSSIIFDSLRTLCVRVFLCSFLFILFKHCLGSVFLATPVIVYQRCASGRVFRSFPGGGGCAPFHTLQELFRFCISSNVRDRLPTLCVRVRFLLLSFHNNAIYLLSLFCFVCDHCRRLPRLC